MNSFIDEHSKKILDSLPEGVYVIDKEFKIKFINKEGYRITKKRPEDILGKVCTTLCRSERCKIGCPITEVLQNDRNVIDLESTIEDSEGNLVPILLNASLLKDNLNNPIGGIISFKKVNKFESIDYYKNSEHFFGIIGKSKAMSNVYNLINEISESFASVIITGETGVGKELVANAIHKTSGRSEKPFVKVNCAVLPGNLLASELFGHTIGAFTGAYQERVGRFEFANGGTIFLDEIAEIPIEMQAQLLRVLQDGTYERLGETNTRYTDIRIIAATNRNIEEEIKKGNFRDDLYYRLNVVPIQIPSLRERREDIPSLVKFFINKFAQKYKKEIDHADANSLSIFNNYNWPGNVRELENCVEYAFARSKRNDYLCSCTLPSYIRGEKVCDDQKTFQEIETDEKTETLLSLLRQNNWNKSKVADILGVDRSTIHRRLKKI